MNFREKESWEISFLLQEINNILECKLDVTPVELIIDKFQERTKSAKEFWECMGTVKWSTVAGIYDPGLPCQAMIYPLCSNDIGKTIENGCHEYIETSRRLMTSQTDPPQNMTKFSHFSQSPYEYANCLRPYKERADKCIPQMKRKCEKSRLNVIKTLRVDFDMIDTLLSQYQRKMHVIHLIRDPRAIVLSRNFKNGINKYLFKSKSLREEAYMLCQQMVKDIKQRRILEKKYPNLITEIYYENLADDTLTKTRELYDFIDEPLQQDIKKWIQKSTSTRNDDRFSVRRGNSSKIAHQWIKHLPEKDKLVIDQECAELYDVTQYNK